MKSFVTGIIAFISMLFCCCLSEVQLCASFLRPLEVGTAIALLFILFWQTVPDRSQHRMFYISAVLWTFPSDPPHSPFYLTTHNFTLCTHPAFLLFFFHTWLMSGHLYQGLFVYGGCGGVNICAVFLGRYCAFNIVPIYSEQMTK